MRPVDPRLLRHARAARGYLIFTAGLGLAVTALVLVQAPVREIYKEYQEAVMRSGASEFLDPSHFVLKAPVNGDALLSAHLHLLQDSVVALARQERTTHQVA